MKLKTTLITAIICISSSTFVTANEPAPEDAVIKAPATIAPAFAYAKVRTAKDITDNRHNAIFEVVVNCPEVIWQIEHKIKTSGKTAVWNEVKTDVKLHEIVLDFESSSQIPASIVMRLDGTELDTKQIRTELANSKRVILSLTGKDIDPFYKEFFAPDILVIVLARDEGMGESKLLPKSIKK